MSRILFFLAATVILAGALFLRTWRIEATPFHADEAVQAAIFQELLEEGRHQYDPRHYHGPLPHYFNWAWIRACGHASLSTLQEWHFRLLPALAGCGLVLAVIVLSVQRHPRAALVAGAFAATSPALVFFSRFGIHESLFVLCGFLAVWAGCAMIAAPGWRPAILTGLLFALTAACKETWIFLAFACLGAALIGGDLPLLKRMIFEKWQAILLAALVFCAAIFVLFGGPGGFGNFWRSYAIYENDPQHNKPVWHYLASLWPKPGFGAGEPWLFLGAAALGLRLFSRNAPDRPERFFGLAGLIFLIVLSLIPYKTPWLMSLPLALMMPLAGWTLTNGPGRSTLIAVVVAAVVAWQGLAAWRLSQKSSWDSRIPLVYSPSSRDLPRLQDYVEKLDLKGPVAVVGSDYWPLPWYLRRLPEVGYFQKMPPPGRFGLTILSGENSPASPEGETGLWGLRENVFLQTEVPKPSPSSSPP